jgi:acyl-coenzyme A thioesterase PaaI-like protein
MDQNVLRARLESVVPFNKHLGIRVRSVKDGSAEVELPQADELLNHVGTQHAAALFAAGEAASGGVILGSFAGVLEDVTPLTRHAEIKYRAPARGPVVASATLAADKRQALAQLEARGRTQIPVEVELTDEQDAKVATMTVRWFLMSGARL